MAATLLRLVELLRILPLINRYFPLDDDVKSTLVRSRMRSQDPGVGSPRPDAAVEAVAAAGPAGIESLALA